MQRPVNTRIARGGHETPSRPLYSQVLPRPYVTLAPANSDGARHQQVPDVSSYMPAQVHEVRAFNGIDRPINTRDR